MARSHAFYYNLRAAVEGRVDADARADAETVYCNAWAVLKRCPNITLKRSKTVVPMFVRFLRWQYYAVFHDDPEIPFLHFQGLFATADAEADPHHDHAATLPPPHVLKKRLEMFLSVLAAVTSPKQLYQHQLLFDYYAAILSKPETSQVKLALDCMLTYKPAFLMPIRENLRRFLDDKKIRDELVVFDPSVDAHEALAGARLQVDVSAGGVIAKNTKSRGGARAGAAAEDGELGCIAPAHRADAVPLLVRLLYGRFVSKARGSKAAREQNLARRAAILSFLSRLLPGESTHLIHLMLRGVAPHQRLLDFATQAAAAAAAAAAGGARPAAASVTARCEPWYAAVAQAATEMQGSDLEHLSWERQVRVLFIPYPPTTSLRPI